MDTVILYTNTMNLQFGVLLKNGEYRIEKVLGQGGFGITYLGVQKSLDDKVAIKEFFMKEHCNRDAATSKVSVGSVGSREIVDSFRNKFTKEARNIRKLKHRNIVSIIDVFEDNDTAYYVMEYFERGNLKELVDRHGPLDETAAVAYVRQLASALEKVHTYGLLHLDIKPANVMLNDSGEAVLIDFGIAKQYDEGGHQTSSALIGTSEGYAPLEQYEAGALGSFTPATDIYALGATLFFLLTGTRPPKASDVMNDGLPALPGNISSPVRNAVEAAMSSRRKDRPQNITEFLALLSDNESTVINDSTVLAVPVVDEDKTEIVSAPVIVPVANNVDATEIADEKAKNADEKLYCPKCGSSQLVANKRGFALGRAITCGLFTWGVGLLAGFAGSNKVRITCLKCGSKWKPGELSTTPPKRE